MQPKITGHTLPVLEIGLDAGEMIIAPPGELAWMTPNIRMNTTTATAGVSGLWGAITRAVSGGGLFMTEFTADGMGGGVAFAPKMPGHIVAATVSGRRNLWRRGLYPSAHRWRRPGLGGSGRGDHSARLATG